MVTLIDILHLRATETPQTLAYRFLADGEREAETVTYAGLEQRALAIAATLRARGVQPGERVLLLYPSSIEYIAAFLACLIAEYIAIPLFPPRPNRKTYRLDAVVENAEPRIILASSDVAKMIKRWQVEEELTHLDLLLTDTISTNDTATDIALPLTDQRPLPADALAYLQYTSGSTSAPKGVMVTHANLIANLKMISHEMGTTPQDASVTWLPFFHDMGLIMGVLHALYDGFPCTFMAPAAFTQRPIRWLQAISDYRGTVSYAPDFAYGLCVRQTSEEQRATLDLASWHVALNGAEPVRASTITEFQQTFARYGFRPAALHPAYGLAEATLAVSGGPPEQEPLIVQADAASLEQQRQFVPVTTGRELVGCGALYPQDLQIVDPATRTVCAPGTIGELWVQGPCVAQGYWQRPDLTAETFQAFLSDTGAGPYLRTGDLGFIHNGELFISGRLKDMIIIRGRNIYPQDIELTAEQSHPILRHGCGAAFAVEQGGVERLVVVQEVERRGRKDLQANEVAQAICTAIVEEHDIVPYAVLLLKPNEVLRTTSGKIQRQANRAAFLEAAFQPTGEWYDIDVPTKSLAPVTNVLTIAQRLQVWIATRKQIDPATIDPELPLATYGLDSLALTAMVTELEQWLDRTLSPTLPYDYPTIQALVGYLTGDVTHTSVSGPRRQKMDEPIAIVGLGCRFPGAPNPDAFWHLLNEGQSAVRSVPADRPSLTNGHTLQAGFVSGVDLFDPTFFEIAPREAQYMDPQQRLLLEVTWEALENAGQAPHQLAGTETGVFVGIATSDYRDLLRQEAIHDRYTPTGTASSTAAGRLAYLLDLHGPALAVDTACSSSLVAVHLACQSLRTGECATALAGGVNLLLSPDLNSELEHAQMLAPDGHCKTFDAQADGYGRGEGCGVVVLKRLSDAERAGDTILGLIHGTAINQDGRSNGLTAPNSWAQQAVIRAALANAGITPEQVEYVEAHGTGTPLGDPIELQALNGVFGGTERTDRPLLVGAVKTNIGHLEAAAGIAGLLKLVLALRNGRIPPQHNLQTLNPQLALDTVPIQIPATATPWPSHDGLHYAGVSSFGFSGTNAHIILAGRPLTPTESLPSQPEQPERPAHLLALSARTPVALKTLAAHYADVLVGPDAPLLADSCYTANTGRTHFNHRLAVVGTNAAEISAALQAFAVGEQPADLNSGVAQRPAPPVAFLFTGQGAQYVQMGRELFATQATFRAALERCDELLQPHLEQPLLTVLYPEDDTLSPISDTAYTQPALFALEYALAQLWATWGVRPAAVTGHSIGEIVAAHVAGVFSLEDALRLVAARGRLMSALPRDGTMAAISADEQRVAAALAPHREVVDIAGLNSPNEIVISGLTTAVEAVVEQLKEEGVRCRTLRVSHAFHSPLLEPMLDEFEAVAATITYHPPTLPLISNLTGQFVEPEAITTAHYWRQNARQAVRFATGVQTLYAQGYRFFLELGPRPVLSGLGQQSVNGEAIWLPSLRPKRSDWQTILAAAANLYTAGVPIDWAGFDRDYKRRKVALPTYPFQRTRYWFDEHPVVQTETQMQDSNGKLPALHSESNGIHPETVADTAPADVSDWAYTIAWRELPPLVTEQAEVPTVAEIAAQTRQALSQTSQQETLHAYTALLPHLDELATGYIVAALQQMGQDWTPGHPIALADLGIQPQYHRLVARLLGHLAQSGLITEHAPEYWTIQRYPIIGAPQDRWAALMLEHPEATAELTLIARCGAFLAEVLRGTRDPMQVLFPYGNQELVENVYERSPAARIMNSLLGTAVQALTNGRKLRVLEIGAGTGGTTATLLPLLADACVEYVYTDISQAFLTRAETKFAAYPFMSYHLLNIEQEPTMQGFMPDQFDLIIAANVVHATSDLHFTLHHIQTLLAPDGRLLLLEATPTARWLDLVFGLAAGWWRFADDLRQGSPLLSAAQWCDLLTEIGFAQVRCTAPERSDGQEFHQALLLAAKPTVPVDSPVHWLVCADWGGTGARLAAQLQQSGARCTLVYAGNGDEDTINLDALVINPTRPDAIQLVLERMLQHSTLNGIVYLWGLDAHADMATSPEHLAIELEQLCGGVLHLVQALGTVGATYNGATPRLWLVTRNGQQVVETTEVDAVQATLWGFGRALAQEHPDLWGGLIDITLDTKPTELAQQLTYADNEDLLALRARTRYGARLVRTTLPTAAAPTFHDSASYLITGGMGTLGLAVARYCADHGAQHLILLGHSPLPARHEWATLPSTHPAAQRVAAIQDLEARGSIVTLLTVDVGNAVQLITHLEELHTLGIPPIRGVVHAAGLSIPALLQQTQLADLRQMFHPKACGAWALHQFFARTPLDFFVFFSSAAALLGELGQGQVGYAAANAFLDGLAYHRRAQGLPALSINWGVWETIYERGSAATRRTIEHVERIGIGMISEQQGVTLFGQALAQQQTQLALLQVDWEQLNAWYPGQHQPQFLAELLGHGAASQPRHTPATAVSPSMPSVPTTSHFSREQLLATEPHLRQQRLANYLCEQLARLLRLPAEQIALQQPLNTLGLDSLMAIELRGHIERQFGATIRLQEFYQDRSLEDIAHQVLTEIDAAVPTADVDEMDEMSEAELQAMLAALDDQEVDTLLQQLTREEGESETD